MYIAKKPYYSTRANELSNVALILHNCVVVGPGLNKEGNKRVRKTRDKEKKCEREKDRKTERKRDRKRK